MSSIKRAYASFLFIHDLYFYPQACLFDQIDTTRSYPYNLSFSLPTWVLLLVFLGLLSVALAHRHWYVNNLFRSRFLFFVFHYNFVYICFLRWQVLALILNGDCSWLVFQKTLVKKHLCRYDLVYLYIYLFSFNILTCNVTDILWFANYICPFDDFLQVRLNGVATFIGIVGLAVAFVVLVVLLVR